MPANVCNRAADTVVLAFEKAIKITIGKMQEAPLDSMDRFRKQVVDYIELVNLRICQ